MKKRTAHTTHCLGLAVVAGLLAAGQAAGATETAVDERGGTAMPAANPAPMIAPVARMEQTGRSSDPRVAVSRRNPKALLRARTVQMSAETETKKEEKPSEEAQSELMTGPPRYVGRRISLDFQQADISNVLRLIAEVSGFNIVVGEGVKSKVTMKQAD